MVDNLMVFDPLDRPITQQDEEGEDEDIAVKSADLRKRIYDMPPMES
jgi:hypothetical protein